MKAGKNSKKAKTDLLLVSLNPYLGRPNSLPRENDDCEHPAG